MTEAAKEDGHLLTEKRAILAAALPHIPFDGWTEAALSTGAKDAGFDEAMALRAFPRGAVDAVAFWSAETDARMADILAAQDMDALKIRKRIALAVRTRLELLEPHRETVRRTLSFLALPQHSALGLKCLYRTLDEMWFQAGDRATDFNFYTKRALLAGVYTSTLLYWLNDGSEGFADSWAFLDRRIADVLKIPQAQAKLRDLPKHAPDPARFIRRLKQRLQENRY